MKEIPLTQGKVALVDDEDYDRVSAYKWFAVRQPLARHPDKWYAYRMAPRPDGAQQMVTMHGFIMGAVDGKIDHKNGDGLRNTKENLRGSTHSQNCANSDRNPGNASRFRGVCRAGNRWRAQISVRMTKTYLGCFIDETEAARAYDAAARHHFGQFARLNFPEEPS